MLKKMCVIRACWIFQKSKMMGYIPVQRRTVWAMIVQVPALVSLFISFVPAFCAQFFFVSFKIDTIFPSHWWEYYSRTLSKYWESTRLTLFWLLILITTVLSFTNSLSRTSLYFSLKTSFVYSNLFSLAKTVTIRCYIQTSKRIRSPSRACTKARATA